MFIVCFAQSQVGVFDDYYETQAPKYEQVGPKHNTFKWNQGVISCIEISNDSISLSYTDKNEHLIWQKNIHFFAIEGRRSNIIFEEESENIFILSRIYSESDKIKSDPRILTIQSINIKGETKSKNISIADINKISPDLSLTKKNFYHVADIEIISGNLFVHFVVRKKHEFSFIFKYNPIDSVSITQILPQTNLKKIKESKIMYAGHTNDRIIFFQFTHQKDAIYVNQYVIDVKELSNQEVTSSALINNIHDDKMYLHQCLSKKFVGQRSLMITSRFTSTNGFRRKNYQVSKYSNELSYIIFGFYDVDNNPGSMDGIWWSKVEILNPKEEIELNTIELKEETSKNLDVWHQIDFGKRNGEDVFQIMLKPDLKTSTLLKRLFIEM